MHREARVIGMKAKLKGPLLQAKNPSVAPCGPQGYTQFLDGILRTRRDLACLHFQLHLLLLSPSFSTIPNRTSKGLFPYHILPEHPMCPLL